MEHRQRKRYREVRRAKFAPTTIDNVSFLSKPNLSEVGDHMGRYFVSLSFGKSPLQIEV